ncbi:MAG: recombinase zinc beta ribbon domain-containing protein [Phycisphaerales bacterium]|nr:recombinase zinc beta ribbon domain-containing protein [Phycisphaerales bacterium]
MKSEYLLSGLMFCGVCGGKLTGRTQTSGKGYKTRYYTCSRRSAGHKEDCPKGYSVPATLVEEYVLGIIRQDLAQLQNDESLPLLVQQELEKLTGNRSEVAERLQRQLAKSDQELANLREHLLSLSAGAAKSLGLYERVQQATEDRERIECELAEASRDAVGVPDLDVLRARLASEFQRLDDAMALGTLEEKRELIACYVQTIKADPDQQMVHISLYPTLMSQIVAGTGFEPVTSGL